MKMPRSVFFCLLWLVSALSAHGQDTPPNSGNTASAPHEGLGRGVVVEKVTKGFAADQAGLQEGDVLLTWSRGDARGEIESPFRLDWLRLEQAPRGPVTLHGLRGPEQRTWDIGPESWKLDTRPNFPESSLAEYLEASELSKKKMINEAAGRWRTLAGKAGGSDAVWLRSWLLLLTARLLADEHQYQESDEAYREAAQASVDAGLPEFAAQIYNELAWGLWWRSDWTNAQRSYEQMLEESLKSGADNLISSYAYGSLGTLARNRDDLLKAESLYLQALAIREKLAPGSLTFSQALANLSTVLRRRGQLPEADELLRRALTVQQKIAPLSIETASTLLSLGSVALDREDYGAAGDYYRQSLEMFEKLVPGSASVASCWTGLGLVAESTGDLGKAEDYYFKALETSKKNSSKGPEVLSILHSLGDVSRERGNLARAEDYYRQGLAIQVGSSGTLNIARFLTGLGMIEWQRGEFLKAEDDYRRSLAIFESQAPGSTMVAATLANLGLVAWSRGDLDRAEKYYFQALPLQEKLTPGGSSLAKLIDNLGLVIADRGDLKKAEEYYFRALSIDAKVAPGGVDFAHNLVLLGRVARELGDFAKAKKYYDQALPILEKQAPDSLEIAELSRNRGAIALAQADLAGAEACYRRALAIGEKLAPASIDHAETLAALAAVALRQGRQNEAAQLFERALLVFETQLSRLGGGELARAGFRARHAAYYNEYIDLLLHQNQPALAFYVLERVRARTILETLAAARLDLRHGVDAGLLERERLLQAEIAAKSGLRAQLLVRHRESGISAVNQEISDLTLQFQDVEGQIRDQSPAYGSLTQPQPLSVEAVQRLLGRGALLLEYSLGDHQSYLWAITPGSARTYQLPGRGEIEKQARRVHGLLTAPGLSVAGETGVQREARLARARKEFREAAGELSRMVLGPAAAELNAKKLLIVSDGALQYIPFAVLPVPGASGVSPDLLVARHEITNLPSASVMAVLRQQAVNRKRPARTVAVLADPVFSADDARITSKPGKSLARGLVDELPDSVAERLTRSAADVGAGRGAGFYLRRLPFSRQEARAILQVAPPGEAKKALDFDASRRVATDPELAKYRIVHFATHGLLNSENPELSGLVLSLVDRDGKPQNGFLDLQDIYNLNLPADLVVLSACETGLGKEIAGEGLIGLTRGFMYAGASRVVASLWSVEDNATAELMKRFYRAMLHDGLAPAAALRKAQMEMLRQPRWTDPYYWGAFVVQGE